MFDEPKTREQGEREFEFQKWLAVLASACRQELNGLDLETYTDGACYQIDPGEWEAYVHMANRTRRYQWFPKLQELLDDLDEWKAQRRQPQTTKLLAPRTAEEAEENERAVEGLKRQRTAAQQEEHRKGVEMLREELEKRGLKVAGLPVKPMPSLTPVGTTTSRTSAASDRMEVLKEQRERITGAYATEPPSDLERE